MNEKRWFAYYHCDEWQSYESMRLIGVFDETTLRKEVAKDLSGGDVSGFEEAFFRGAAIHELPIRELSTRLEYALIQEIKLNERQ